jgi:zinc protease
MKFFRLIIFTFIVMGLWPYDLAQANHKAGHTINVVRVLSPGGIEAWLVSDHSNPIINMHFAFRGGASLDPDGKEGLANMVSGLLDEGAGDLDSQAFQRRLEDLSIVLRFDAGRDTFQGRVKTLSDNKNAAFALLKSAIGQPLFDDEPVNRIRSQILAGLNRSSQNPNTVASLTLAKELFPNHPYGRPVEGTPESIKAISRPDLKAFVNKRFARDNLVIGVVGDIGPNELERYLDHVFLSLPAYSKATDVKEARPQTSGRTKVIEMDVPQSAIVFAQKGLKRDDPDYYKALVLNHVLGGGGFTSRLYNEIREKRGLAYSIGSYLYPRRHAGLLQGYGGTANKRVGETLKVLKKEWRLMANKGVEAKTLSDAKTYLIGSYPLRFTSSRNIAAILVSMQLEDLGINFLDQRNSIISSIKLEDLNTTAKKLLDPDNLVIVIVGTPEGVISTP